MLSMCGIWRSEDELDMLDLEGSLTCSTLEGELDMLDIGELDISRTIG